jgi:hypothetical protein
VTHSCGSLRSPWFPHSEDWQARSWSHTTLRKNIFFMDLIPPPNENNTTPAVGKVDNTALSPPTRCAVAMATLFGNLNLWNDSAVSPLPSTSSPVSSPSLLDPSYQPTRLLCLNSSRALFCSGNEVSFIDIARHKGSPQLSLHQDLVIDTGNVQRTTEFFLKSRNNFRLSSLKPLQSLCRLSETVCGAIDSGGLLSLMALSPSESETCLVSSNSFWQTTKASYYSVGWVGLAAVGQKTLASCHFLTRELIWSDVERMTPQRSCLLPGNPTSLSSAFSAEDTSLIFCGDGGGGFGVWDVRQGEKGELPLPLS